MRLLRLPILVVLLLAYTMGYATVGNMPRILCQEADGRICVETVLNRCCHVDGAGKTAHDHPDDDGCCSPCGQCTDSDIPPDQHEGSSPQGKLKPIVAVGMPVDVVCPPAGLALALDTRPPVLPLPCTAGQFTILRC